MIQTEQRHHQPPSAKAKGSSHQWGFTLIEVLVALAIVAIALAAGSRAIGALINNAGRQSEVLLAQICADNELVAARLLLQMPPIGTTQKQCEQAGRVFTVKRVTTATINPALRRVDAQVSTNGHFVLSVSTLIGRF